MNHPSGSNGSESKSPAAGKRAAAIAQWLLVGACVSSFVAGLLIEHHPHFAFEAWPGFFAVFGFIAYCFIVLSAKQLRPWLRREEDYYGDDPELADGADSDSGDQAAAAPEAKPDD